MGTSFRFFLQNLIFLKIWRDRAELLFFFGSRCRHFFARNFARNPEFRAKSWKITITRATRGVLSPKGTFWIAFGCNFSIFFTEYDFFENLARYDRITVFFWLKIPPKFARNFARNPEISREILENHENDVSTLIHGILYGLEVLWDHPDDISVCLVARLGFLELFFGPKWSFLRPPETSEGIWGLRKISCFWVKIQKKIAFSDFRFWAPKGFVSVLDGSWGLFGH